jgi:hypothetical protein
MTFDIKVVSQRNLSSEIGYKDIVIDRTTALGNPYDMNKTQGREVVIAAYRRYLWNCIQMEKEDPCQFPQLEKGLLVAGTFRHPEVGVVVDRIRRLAREQTNIRLLCWCSPAACHGDVIKSCILWMRNQQQQSDVPQQLVEQVLLSK